MTGQTNLRVLRLKPIRSCVKKIHTDALKICILRICLKPRTLLAMRREQTSVLKLFLDGERLGLESGSTELTYPDWVVPFQTWTHVGIQIYDVSCDAEIH